jgi:hypothetical protein
MCDPDLTFTECQEFVLSQKVSEIEYKQGVKLMQDPEIITMLALTTKFLKTNKCVIYGGTAVNNILPKKYQFYDYKFQLPDYDAYHPEALRLIKEAADVFHKKKFNVEAKAGLHYNTFKLFVNNIPLIDLTNMPHDLYEELKKTSIVRDGLIYAPPDFLRMSMYLELSRPDGDVSRWPKVFNRLARLNAVYPMKATACTHKPIQFLKETYSVIYKVLVAADVLFIGGYAFRFYTKVTAMSEFDVISLNPAALCKQIKAYLPHAVVHTHEPIGSLIGEHHSVSVDGKHLLFVFPTSACHNYKEVTDVHGNSIKIGTIDTLFSYYLVFLYAKRPYMDPSTILCSCKELFDVSETEDTERFKTACYGKQETLVDIRREKNNYRKTLKPSDPEFEKRFLYYNPANK